MRRAIGMTVHTGWGLAVMVAGSPERPLILGQRRIEVLQERERFCYHRAAEMPLATVKDWLEELRRRALAQARGALAALLDPEVVAAGLVAKDGVPGPLENTLASHPRWHAAEACFYRDLFRDALGIPARIVTARSLDPGRVGRIAPPPWGRDQKLAALAAWQALEETPARVQ